MRKLSIHLLNLLLIVSVIPLQPVAAFAETFDASLLEEDIVLFSEDEEQEIELHQDSSGAEVIMIIPDDSEATILLYESEENEEEAEYLPIRFTYLDGENEI